MPTAVVYAMTDAGSRGEVYVLRQPAGLALRLGLLSAVIALLAVLIALTK